MASVADVLKLWTQVPTRALVRRYAKVAGCDKDSATTCLLAYKSFMALKIIELDYDDEALAPPPAIHTMWREHLLDTAGYSEHCRTLCGRMLHHAPHDTEDGAKQHARRCHRTLQAFKQHFGEDAKGAPWDCGPLAALSEEEMAHLYDDAPAAKRARSIQQLSVSVQAPYLPMRTVSTRSDATIRQFFQARLLPPPTPGPLRLSLLLPLQYASRSPAS
jgi:hypothetical protein